MHQQNNKNIDIKKELWKFLRNVSIITLVTTIIIFLTILLNKGILEIIIIAWPLIAILPFAIVLSLILLIISLLRIKRIKKMKEVK